jgi:hypothetical protein
MKGIASTFLMTCLSSDLLRQDHPGKNGSFLPGFCIFRAYIPAFSLKMPSCKQKVAPFFFPR